MLLGLRTAIYHVDDLDKAKEWYTQVVGHKPYFDQPFYVGFNCGGYELGLDPDSTGISKGGSTFVYWGVADAHLEYERLLKLGALRNTDLQDVGDGILIGTLLDPWGNIFGIIQNPHFKLEAAQ